MTKSKILFILLVFILFSTPVLSVDLYQYGVIAEIFENNTVHYRLSLVLTNHPAQMITFPIGSSYDIDLNSTADCNILKGTLETSIICSMKAADRTDISITYSSNEKIGKRDNYFLFIDSFRPMSDVNTISILIKLPEGTGLKKPTETSSSPEGALIGSDGRRPIINWVKNDLKAGERFDVSVAFEKVGEIVISSIPMEIIIMVLIVIVLAFVIVYKFYLKKGDMKMIFPIMKKDEKMIFDTIMKHGSGVNQKIIVRDSGYSKAKVSKVLNSLRERGLVKLERIGRSNKVHIEKKFEKKS
jgi:uncharacterized membrane protein